MYPVTPGQNFYGQPYSLWLRVYEDVDLMLYK